MAGDVSSGANELLKKIIMLNNAVTDKTSSYYTTTWSTYTLPHGVYRGLRMGAICVCVH